MAEQRNIYGYGSTQIAVGLSQVIRIQPSAGEWAEQFKYLSGGSLEIVPIQLSGSSTAAGGAWGKGYLMGTSEVFPQAGSPGPAVFYLAATGATAIIGMVIGYTEGSALL